MLDRRSEWADAVPGFSWALPSEARCSRSEAVSPRRAAALRVLLLGPIVALLVGGLCGCACRGYQIDLVAEPGMNRGVRDAVRVDLVWMTAENAKTLEEVSAHDWFGKRMHDEDEYAPLVVSQSVSPEEGKFAFPDARVLPPEGYEVTGFVIYAFYEEPGEKASQLRLVRHRNLPPLSTHCHLVVKLESDAIELEPGKPKKMWGLLQ